jgi:transcriptional regulator with XRE-family HTH domain
MEMQAREIGERIRAERSRQGWDQAELARRLGDSVGQQTISAWETGRSRPQREMVVLLAGVFDLDVDELLQAAGYSPHSNKADQPGELPVRPLLTLLPAEKLQPDTFEELIADIAGALYPHAQVARFGGRGHAQSGFDIVVQSHGRFQAGFQCKRHREFGARKVAGAVAAASLDVDQAYLVISRQVASRGARLEMRKHPHWQLWDSEDISRTIRSLPNDAKLRIVNTYFPGFREPFLGLAEPGPWLTTDEFHRPLVAGAIYSQAWRLVGRSQELSDIVGFIDNAALPLAFLVGRGGIGKSRLLLEAARLTEDRGIPVRFLRPGVDLQPQDYERLPEAPRLLIVIDDAHEQAAHVLASLNDLNRVRPGARVILTLRPYALPALRSELIQLGVMLGDLPVWELGDLGVSDAVQLATQALGDVDARLAERLGRLTVDCPFITVVAGVLIQRGELDPACLDHEERIRDAVLDRFREVVTATAAGGDKDQRSGVLDAVAAFQPFRSDDGAFQRSLAALTELSYDQAFRHLRSLEEAGVLIRRGASMRIVPDLLGDVVLARIAFDEASRASTRFIERAWEAAEGNAKVNVFTNANRVDWQTRHDYAGAQPLVDTLWDALEADLSAAGIEVRLEIARIVEQVAYFNPHRALRVVRWLIDNPTANTGASNHDLVRWLVGPAQQSDLLAALAPILRNVAYHLDCVPDAFALLRRLAAGDSRPLNQYPNHPMRILSELCALDPAKPLAYNQAMVDVVDAWLTADPGPETFRALSLLQPMLATEGMTTTAEGWTVQLRHHFFLPDSVKELRARVVAIALRELRSTDLARAYQAVKLLESGLHAPMGQAGRPVGDTWTESLMGILEPLRQLVSEVRLDPFIYVGIRAAVKWHAEFSTTTTRNAAQAVLDALPAELEDRVALALYDGWGHLAARSDSLHETDQAQRRRNHQLAQDLLAAGGVAHAVDLLAARLSAQQVSDDQGRSASPGPFAWALVACEAAVGETICQRVAREPSSTLASLIPVALAALAEADVAGAIESARLLLETNSVGLRQAVAQAFGWNRGARAVVADDEIALLQSLARDPDPYVRQAMVMACRRLAATEPTTALHLLAGIPFADSPRVAAEVFEVLAGTSTLFCEKVSETDRVRFLEQIAVCSSIDGYWIEQFFSELSSTDPKTALSFLTERIDRWEGARAGGDEQYRPLPHHWNFPLRFREGTGFLGYIRDLLQWLTEHPGSWHRHEGGGRLFAAMAGQYDEPVVRLLEEALVGASEARLRAVASVVRYAPRRFVFDNVLFVRRLLAAAANAGDAAEGRVFNALHASVLSGVRFGASGRPFAEDVEQEQESRRIAADLPLGSPEHRFYRFLEASAAESIRRNEEEDARMLDGRAW